MRRSVDEALDDHPQGDERPRSSWVVALLDDCEACGDVRVEVVLEEEGAPGTGVAAHLSPSSARKLRAALATALREIGEQG